MHNLSTTIFSFEIGLKSVKKLCKIGVSIRKDVLYMAADFVKFRRIMAQLDAQLKKEDAMRKQKTNVKKKESKK